MNRKRPITIGHTSVVGGMNRNQVRRNTAGA
jgi:hypothetical protein